MRAAAIVMVVLVMLVLPGCSWWSLDAQFVGAVDRHVQVILPEYEKYVQADSGLDTDSVRIRLQSAEALRALIAGAKEK